VRDLAADTLIDNRYRVIGRLGSGGMADVYCAEDLQLGRRVALKLLYRRLAADAAFVERFRREASAAASLQHPNVVQVFDRGEWDGTSYIAMECLDGRTLKEIVRAEGPMAPRQAVDVVLQVLKALRFAHRRGIVHRDIKPHNVMMDDEGRVKVTDFGIARAGASDMTETGSIMGTAQYLSPEQAQGRPVDARSDLYSVGVVLYELLTGRVPFDGESAVTVALKHVSEVPLPPSRLAGAVSPALDAVVLRALEKEPDQRFQNADEMIAALSGEQTPPPAAREPRSWRWLWWVLAALAAVGIAVGAWLLLRPEMATVPDVVELSAATAAQKLENEGFDAAIQQVESDSVERGRVTSQNPDAGEEAEQGSTVTIRVSTGPGEALIPDVTGEGRQAAQDTLEEAGFKVKRTEEASDDVRENRVIETRPPAGTSQQKGTTVTMVVSSGPDQVEVPDVRELDREGAEEAIESRGLRASVRTQESDQEEPGQVLAQDPAPGTMVDEGSEVSVTVATEPAEAPVPDMVGLALDEALDELQEAGFRVRRRTQPVQTPDEHEVVLSQDPAAGESLARDETVTITVGDFDPGNLDPAETPTATATPTP
jgi:serine/threonine-protein kinase